MAFHSLEQNQEPAAGFVPLSGTPKDRQRRGFTPLQADPERDNIGKQIALNNPVTAIAETGLNLASQAVALPAAGLAGLATETGNALGLTEKKGADVVHSVGEAMTYQPRGEMGKAAAGVVAYPFEKLAEAGHWAGSKTLDATGSPLAATVVDTAVNVLPMVIDPAIRAARKAKTGGVESGAGEVTPPEVTPRVTQNSRGFVQPDDLHKLDPISRQAERHGFVPLDDAPPAAMAKSGEANADPAMGSYRQNIENAAGVVSGDPAPRGFQPLKEVGDGIADQNIPTGIRRAQVGDSLVYGPDQPELSMVRGGGITVCPEWMASFAAFLMHVGPKPKHSRLLWLGRLDVNKGYEPGNVAWLPHRRQISNRRYCRRMQFEGQELTLEEISRELGLAPGGLKTRIVRLEMAPAKALTSGPVQYRKTAVMLTHNGQTMSLPEWARKVGIRREKLRNRLTQGWPLKKALQPGDFRRKQASSP